MALDKTNADIYVKDMIFDKDKFTGKFKCTKCKKEFKNQTHLKMHFAVIHNKIQTKRKPTLTNIDINHYSQYMDFKKDPFTLKFKCNICNKSYTRKENAKVHFLAHHAKIRFNCDTCSNTFKRESDKNIHEKTYHRQICEYKCLFCNKQLKSKKLIKMHIKYKHGKETYTCSICEKNFSNNSNLKKHIRNTHEKLRHKCQKCDKTFSDGYRLTVHFKMEHKKLIYSMIDQIQ